MAVDQTYTITEYLANGVKRKAAYRAIRPISMNELTDEFMAAKGDRRIYRDDDEGRWYLIERIQA